MSGFTLTGKKQKRLLLFSGKAMNTLNDTENANMEVRIIKETGYEEALRGMALSYFDNNANDVDLWWERQKERAEKRAGTLFSMGGGHNKFLRQIILFVEINAPRAWWSEFDTYKVGTVAQSTSTMHTLSKRPPTHLDFEKGTTVATMDCFIQQWSVLKGNITQLKENLPEGYLQRRLVTMNYENIRNIVRQRTGHRYQRWGEFIKQLLDQIEHPDYLK